MKIAIEILLIASFSVWFAELSPIVPWVKKWLAFEKMVKGVLYMRSAQSRLKPFDCPLCLAWWTGLIYFLFTTHSPIAIIYGACCSLLAVWISKQVTPNFTSK